ncbi:MAG TPA: hypothetical protein PKD63_14765 [Solirubrobacteraceae bacterium]|nr:hypothetical protein [Solirubrobacteraceae bacterium]
MSDDARTSDPPTRDRRRRRLGLASIAVLGLSWALIMQSLGWAQTSYFAFVKALNDGTAQIDDYHWETRDKSWTNGHFFSVKAPGLPVLLVPPYAVLKAVGADDLARDAARTAREGGARQWTYRGLNIHAYGYDAERAVRVKALLADQAPMIWALGLLGTVLPTLLLLLLIRWLADRWRPGLGTATALSVGTGTIVMTFAVNLFAHMLAAFMAFAVFALLWRERQSAPRLPVLLGAGLLSGLVVVVEYPLALAGAILGVYGMLHPQALGRGLVPLASRGAVYAAGVIAGVLPALAYNQWAFGSIGTMSYDNAVDRQGFTGHDTLGLNSGGFFGITMPDARVALELLISPRGLFALTPVVLMGVVGVVLLHRRGMKAEARTIAAIALAFFIYDTGYWLPFGGGSPGPRFLIPVLPFIGVALVEAWRRFPSTTLVTTVCGAVVMTVATLTYPLIGTGSMWQWWDRVEGAVFQHTIPTVFGAGDGWLALAPVLIGLLAVAWLGARATGALPVSRDLRLGVSTLAGWVVLALVIAPAFGERKIVGVGKTAKGDVEHTGLPWQIVLLAAACAAIALALAWRAERRSAGASPAEAVDEQGAAALALQPQLRG